MTRRRKGKTGRDTPQADPTSEITTAVAHTLNSLEALTEKCRDHGIDPMTTIMSVMSRMRSSQPAIEPVAASAWAATHANIVQRSRAFVEALDRADVEAVEAVLAPGFIHVVGRNVADRETSLSRMRQRTEKVPYFAERTWENETVTPNGDAVVFNGKAREVQGNNETHGGYINEGWYALQWSCIGTAWRVRFLSWQKDTTDRNWWNDTFVSGRGFNHEPNQLLVTTVEDVTPGTALDLAMGQGRNELFLASRGWEVLGVDISDEGQRLAREQATKRGLALETVTANIDEWDFGVDRFELVTLLYAGDDAKWIDKIKASLRIDRLVVVEGWAQVAPDSPIGFAAGQLSTLFADYTIVRDEVIDDVPDWARDQGTLVRFVARKRR